MNGPQWPVDPTAYLLFLWEVFLWSVGAFLVAAVVLVALYELFRPRD